MARGGVDVDTIVRLVMETLPLATMATSSGVVIPEIS